MAYRKITKTITVDGKPLEIRNLTAAEMLQAEDVSLVHMVAAVVGADKLAGLGYGDAKEIWRAVLDLTYGSEEQEKN